MKVNDRHVNKDVDDDDDGDNGELDCIGENNVTSKGDHGEDDSKCDGKEAAKKVNESWWWWSTLTSP